MTNQTSRGCIVRMVSFCGLALAIMGWLTAGPAKADSLSVSITAPTTPVTEGSSFTVVQTDTYAGTAAGDLYLLSPGFFEFFYASGDSTDAPSLVSETESGACPSPSLSLGTGPVSGTCTLTYTYSTVVTGTDADSGDWNLECVTIGGTSCASLTDFSALTVTATATAAPLLVEVTDPVEAVPEPSGVLLLGTGLLAVVGAVRRKRVA